MCTEILRDPQVVEEVLQILHRTQQRVPGGAAQAKITGFLANPHVLGVRSGVARRRHSKGTEEPRKSIMFRTGGINSR